MSFEFFIALFINTLAYAIPAYGSYKAVESNDEKRVREYLKYWMIITLFTIIFGISDLFLFWLPFYSFIKYVFFIWLCLPSMNGYSVIYSKFFAPLLETHYESINDILMNVTDIIISNLKDFIKWSMTTLSSVVNYLIDMSQTQFAKHENQKEKEKKNN